MSAAESAPPTPAKTGRPVLWQILALLLCAGGLALSLHLLHRGLILKNDPFPSIDPCKKVFGWFAVDAGCDNTLQTPLSSLFGVPIAGWGVIYFAGLAALLVLSLVQSAGFRREATAAGLLLTSCGAAGALYLASLMALGKVPVCPACLAVHVLCLGLVPLLKLSYAGTLREWTADLLAGALYVLGRKSATPVESGWKAIGFVNVLLVAVTAFVWVDAAQRSSAVGDVKDVGDVDDEVRERQIAARRAEVLKKYDESRTVAIPVADDDPRIGPQDAPCQIVVFSTFRCKGCKAVALALENLRKDFGNDISIVYKYQTYGEEKCPADQSEADAPASCRANWAAEAARRQGKFAEYHDALYHTGVECREEDLVAAAREVGLDLSRFDADRRSAEVRERVSQHYLLGAALGVVVTPDVLLNGKRLPELGQQQFVWVVDHVLDGRLDKALAEPSPAAESGTGTVLRNEGSGGG